MRDETERVVPPREIIFDAPHHQRRTAALTASADLFGRKAHRADDAGVERTSYIVPRDLAAECEAYVNDVTRLVAIVIYADQRTRFEMIGAFFQRFAYRPRDQ